MGSPHSSGSSASTLLGSTQGMVALLAALAGLATQLTNLPVYVRAPITVLGLGVGAYIFVRHLAKSSEPQNLARFTLSPRDATQLIGREEVLEKLLGRVFPGRSLLLIGESGVGKSAFVQSGLIPALRDSGNWIVLAHSSYGSDWSRSLIDSTLALLRREHDAKSSSKVKRQEEMAQIDHYVDEIRARGRHVLFVFDQFDDYQTQHSDRFKPGGSPLSPEELRRDNPYWDGIADLLSEERVCCLFVCRDDVQEGLRSVGFHRDESLTRLHRVDASRILDHLRRFSLPEDGGGEAAVTAPEAGWGDLARVLVRDLSEGGAVLPQQLKVALAGVSKFDSLTVREYQRRGGVAGLESGFIRREVRAAADESALSPKRIYSVLLALVHEREGSKGLAISFEEALRAGGWDVVGNRERKALKHALASLERSQVCRRISSLEKDGVLWRLDHDYLARPIEAAARDENTLERELDDQAELFWEAWPNPVRSWTQLLPLARQWKLALAAIRGTISIRRHAGYFGFSLVRLVPPLAIVSMLGGLALRNHDLQVNALVREHARRALTANGLIQEKFIGEEFPKPEDRFALLDEAFEAEVSARQYCDSVLFVLPSIVGTSGERRRRVLEEYVRPNLDAEGARFEAALRTGLLLEERSEAFKKEVYAKVFTKGGPYYLTFESFADSLASWLLVETDEDVRVAFGAILDRLALARDPDQRVPITYPPRSFPRQRRSTTQQLRGGIFECFARGVPEHRRGAVLRFLVDESRSSTTPLVQQALTECIPIFADLLCDQEEPVESRLVEQVLLYAVERPNSRHRGGGLRFLLRHRTLLSEERQADLLTLVLLVWSPSMRSGRLEAHWGGAGVLDLIAELGPVRILALAQSWRQGSSRHEMEGAIGGLLQAAAEAEHPATPLLVDACELVVLEGDSIFAFWPHWAGIVKELMRVDGDRARMWIRRLHERLLSEGITARTGRYTPAEAGLQLARITTTGLETHIADRLAEMAGLESSADVDRLVTATGYLEAAGSPDPYRFVHRALESAYDARDESQLPIPAIQTLANTLESLGPPEDWLGRIHQSGTEAIRFRRTVVFAVLGAPIPPDLIDEAIQFAETRAELEIVADGSRGQIWPAPKWIECLLLRQPTSSGRKVASSFRDEAMKAREAMDMVELLERFPPVGLLATRITPEEAQEVLAHVGALRENSLRERDDRLAEFINSPSIATRTVDPFWGVQAKLFDMGASLALEAGGDHPRTLLSEYLGSLEDTNYRGLSAPIRELVARVGQDDPTMLARTLSECASVKVFWSAVEHWWKESGPSAEIAAQVFALLRRDVDSPEPRRYLQLGDIPRETFLELCEARDRSGHYEASRLLLLQARLSSFSAGQRSGSRAGEPLLFELMDRLEPEQAASVLEVLTDVLQAARELGELRERAQQTWIAGASGATDWASLLEYVGSLAERAGGRSALETQRALLRIGIEHSAEFGARQFMDLLRITGTDGKEYAQLLQALATPECWLASRDTITEVLAEAWRLDQAPEHRFAAVLDEASDRGLACTVFELAADPVADSVR